MSESPSCSASLRVLQGVEPAPGLRVRVHSRMRLELRREGARTVTGMAREQPRQPPLSEATAPAGDEGVIAIELLADLFPGVPRSQQQDQPRATGIVGPPGAAVGSLTLFHTFCIRQGDRAHGHEHTAVSVVTVHQQITLPFNAREQPLTDANQPPDRNISPDGSGSPTGNARPHRIIEHELCQHPRFEP